MTFATPKQLAVLSVPATLPGVVRRGTPVTVNFGGQQHAVVVDVQEGHAIVAFEKVWRGAMGDGMDLAEDYSVRRALSDLHVDLTDATGRAHVAWALAATAKHWPTESDYTTATWREYHGLTRSVGIAPSHWWPWSHHVLAELDPDDDTHLPNGSRWVDAEALRLIALHVLGGAS